MNQLGPLKITKILRRFWRFQVVLILSLVADGVTAQVLPEAKPDLLYSSISNSLINPAGFDSTDYLIGAFGIQNRIGAFKKIRDISAFGQYSLNDKRRLKVEVYSNQRGPYIKKNRFYLGYNNSIALNSKLKLSAGLNFGYSNILFISNTASSGASDGSFDGSIGLLLYSDNVDFGLAYQQFNSPIIAPLNYTFELSPYYEVHASKTFVLEQSSLNIKGRLRYFDEYQQTFAALTYKYQESVILGATYSHNHFTGFTAGVASTFTEQYGVQALISYSIASRSSTRPDLLELMVVLSLR